MMNINRVVISGNLTREPQLKRSQSGSDILKIGVAVNDRRKNASTGEWEDYANFVDAVVFGKRAVALEKILTKGAKVVVEGKLRWSQWESNGEKLSKIEIIADNVEFMIKQHNDNSVREAQVNGLYDEDIPF